MIDVGEPWSALIVSAVAAIAVAVVGGVATDVGPWYKALRKPSWKPPDWAFGPIWTVILALAALSAALAWTAAPSPGWRVGVVALFLLNALFNAAWSVLFFTLRRPDWALVEALALWLSVLAPMIAIFAFAPAAALALAPYLIWVTIAIRLNLWIVRENGPFGADVAARWTR